MESCEPVKAEDETSGAASVIIVNPGAATSTKRRSAPTHNNKHSDHAQKVPKLISPDDQIYNATNETQVEAELRVVTRKDVPWNIFRSIYLCDSSPKARPKLTVHSLKGIGDGNWEERPSFLNQLRKVLSDKVRCSIKPLFIHIYVYG
jgi:hypothetical protein